MDRFSVFSLFLMFLHLTFCFTGRFQAPVFAEEGEDRVLSCSGHPGVRVSVLQWIRLDQRRDLLVYRAGKVLQGYEHPDYTDRVQLRHPQLLRGDLSVVLKEVTLEDSGKYQCKTLYEDGQEISQIIFLWIKGKGGFQAPVLAEEGEDPVLPCSGRPGVRVSVLLWIRLDLYEDLLVYRAGKVLQGYEHPDYTNRVQLRHPHLQNGDLSVVLKEVTLKDGGKYQCKTLYEDKQETSQFIFLWIQGKDSVKSVSAAEGEDCVLPCSDLLGTEIILMWSRLDPYKDLLLFRGGKVLNGFEHPLYTDRVQLLDPHLQRRDFSLVLKEVTLKDSGTYICYTLYDDKHWIFQSIRLRVTEPDTTVLGLSLGLPSGLGLIVATVIAVRYWFNKRLTQSNRR